MEYLTPERVEVHYVLPLAEIVFDFFDQLKSRTRGFASLDYEPWGYQESKLVRVDVMLHGEPVDAFSSVVHRDKAYEYGKRMTERLEGADPAAAVRRRGAGLDRLEGDRPRDREGQAQGRAREVLRRRHHAQAQAPRDPEEGQGADAARRQGRRAAGRVHRRRCASTTQGGGGHECDAGIYVHIPFCLTRCGYCDFNAYEGLDELKPRYLRALLTEAELAAPGWEGSPFVSVFLGGGTPTTMAPADLRALLVAPARPLRSRRRMPRSASRRTPTRWMTASLRRFATPGTTGCRWGRSRSIRPCSRRSSGSINRRRSARR